MLLYCYLIVLAFDNKRMLLEIEFDVFWGMLGDDEG